jgi:hypothetical protein
VLLYREVVSRVRAWIVRLLDRSPRTCWAELVLWWAYPEDHPFFEIFNCGNSRIWYQSCTPQRGAYCGKCERTGRLWRRG